MIWVYHYSTTVTNQDEIWMSISNPGSNISSKYEHNQGNRSDLRAILRTVETIKRKRRRSLAGAAAQAMEKPHNIPDGGVGRRGSKQGASRQAEAVAEYLGGHAARPV
jgi:hypothetical protein